MAIKYPITLSTTEPNNNIGLLKIRQADEETQMLVVQILEDAIPKSYDGLQVFFCARIGQTPGLGIIEQKLTEDEMTDPKKGKLEYTFRSEDWQVLGRQTGYFSFRKMVDDHTYEQQFSTRDFNYEVIKNIYSDGIREVTKDGSTYVWTIEDLIRLFNEYIATGKTDWEEFVEQNKEIIESVDPGGTVLSELIRSRKPAGATTSYPDLPTRLDEQIGKNEEFRDFESANSFMKRVNNEFSERALNSKWFDTSTNAAMQSLIDFAISEKRNITFETGDYLLPLIIDGAVDMTIDFASSNLNALVDNQTNNPLLEIKNCQKLTIKNFTIDGLGKSPRAIQITNSKVLAIHNFTVENLNLSQDGSVNTSAIEIDTTQCRDIQISDFKIDNLRSINNDIIGDAQGMTRGIHLKSSEKKSLKNAKILFSNFTITNLESEDADAIHLLDCGEIDVTFQNFFISNCYARGIKIQNTTNAAFRDFEISSEENYLFRQSAISDYSGGNMFTDFKIDVNAKYGIDFLPNFEHQEIGLISNGRIFMESETVVNGSNSYPIYIGTGSFAMKNLTIQNMVLITKNTYGIVSASYTENLVIKEVTNFTTGTGLMNGIGLSVDYSNTNKFGATHSHVNLSIDNILADIQGVYMSAQTTVSKSSAITNIKTKQQQSLNGMAGTRRVVVAPPDFYRSSTASTDKDYEIGNVLWNNNFNANPDVACWIVVSKNADGTAKLKAVKMSDI
ncbi:phage baseplate upper protein [Enterococcus gallinarum]|nr:phage baseplate upper protein [Enterococcus gallinarum]MBF0726257.1 phage baseplate upper protein [Enterococcus gallinarum]MDL4880757.1 phage baseplate upper protein [Enterococcus gallinarum]MDL4884305.1 phage baseplate upper protein [Enterococcus gallinarum]MDL4893034.1 phage baseplate upper protein [Enterococcus gallinarum]NYS82358.1 phage baseplate upper protein [Enterococcus gallinarum]